MPDFITMFKLAKDKDTIRQVVIHNEDKADLESIGFVDHIDKVVDESEKPAPKKKATKAKAKAK